MPARPAARKAPARKAPARKALAARQASRRPSEGKAQLVRAIAGWMLAPSTRFKAHPAAKRASAKK
jgi:hypothetical protein